MNNKCKEIIFECIYELCAMICVSLAYFDDAGYAFYWTLVVMFLLLCIEQWTLKKNVSIKIFIESILKPYLIISIATAIMCIIINNNEVRFNNVLDFSMYTILLGEILIYYVAYLMVCGIVHRLYEYFILNAAPSLSTEIEENVSINEIKSNIEGLSTRVILYDKNGKRSFKLNHLNEDKYYIFKYNIQNNGLGNVKNLKIMINDKCQFNNILLPIGEKINIYILVNRKNNLKQLFRMNFIMRYTDVKGEKIYEQQENVRIIQDKKKKGYVVHEYKDDELSIRRVIAKKG